VKQWQFLLKLIVDFNWFENQWKIKLDGGLWFQLLQCKLGPTVHHFIGDLSSYYSCGGLYSILSLRLFQLAKNLNESERGKMLYVKNKDSG
jgi:hypothetical protein